MTAAATAPTRPILRYHGSKWMVAPWIIGHMPKHRVYTEAFGGAAAVLLRKPRAYAEIYNDLDGDIVDLFRVLQNAEAAADLARRVFLTPWARAEFELSYDVGDTPDAVERARRLIVRSFFGFGSDSTNPSWRTGFRAGANRQGTTPQMDWRTYPGAIPAFVDRLRGVVVEQRPATDVLRAHDRPDALHYVDPPYVHATRTPDGRARQAYRFEMSDDDHRALAGVLHGLRGMVVLSGYASELYDVELYAGWKRFARAAFADGGAARTEVLWLNDAAATALGRERLVLL